MKVVINKCYGGFGLSVEAVERVAELMGRKCFWFKHGCEHLKEPLFIPVSKSEAAKAFLATAFDREDFDNLYMEMRKTEQGYEKSNSFYSTHEIPNFRDDRTNPILVQVVEELGEKASGPCARLRVVTIPDGVQWQLDEYDGVESIHEVHEVWG